MLKRKVILSKDSVLWYAGDPAVSLAVVESGKLGVRTTKGLTGVLRPNMVLGDTSILALEGGQPRRLATISALEEGTTVTEYPPSLVRQSADDPDHALWKAILTMLLGQVYRNGLVLVAAHEAEPFLARPFRSLVESLVETHEARFAALAAWDDFLATYRFLSATRDYTDTALAALVGPAADRDLLLRASEAATDFFRQQGRFPFLVDHIEAAKERWALEEAPATV